MDSIVLIPLTALVIVALVTVALVTLVTVALVSVGAEAETVEETIAETRGKEYVPLQSTSNLE